MKKNVLILGILLCSLSGFADSNEHAPLAVGFSTGCLPNLGLVKVSGFELPNRLSLQVGKCKWDENGKLKQGETELFDLNTYGLKLISKVKPKSGEIYRITTIALVKRGNTNVVLQKYRLQIEEKSNGRKRPPSDQMYLLVMGEDPEGELVVKARHPMYLILRPTNNGFLN